MKNDYEGRYPCATKSTTPYTPEIPVLGPTMGLVVVVDGGHDAIGQVPMTIEWNVKAMIPKADIPLAGLHSLLTGGFVSIPVTTGKLGLDSNVAKGNPRTSTRIIEERDGLPLGKIVYVTRLRILAKKGPSV